MYYGQGLCNQLDLGRKEIREKLAKELGIAFLQ